MEGHRLLCGPQQLYWEWLSVTGLVPANRGLLPWVTHTRRMEDGKRCYTDHKPSCNPKNCSGVLHSWSNETSLMPLSMTQKIQSSRETSAASPGRREFSVPALLVYAYAEARLKLSVSWPISHGWSAAVLGPLHRLGLAAKNIATST